MTTHEIRHHGRLIEHMDEKAAHEYVNAQIDGAGLEEDARARREHEEAWEVGPRRPVELHVRGNLVDTFDTAEEALEAKAALLAGPDVEGDGEGAPSEFASPSEEPETELRMVDAKPAPAVAADRPRLDPKTRKLTFETIVDPSTHAPVMRTVQILKETKLTSDRPREAIVIVDRSAAAKVATATENARARPAARR